MSSDVNDAAVIASGLPTGWNDTATTYERDATVAEVVAARIAEYPDALAIEDATRSLTYRELDQRAANVSRRLAPFIDGADQCVGVMAHRSIDAIVAFLGVLRAGAAYVPLDAALPAEQLRFMADDTSVRVVLAPADLVGDAAGVTGRAVLGIEDEERPVVDPPQGAPAPPTTGPTSLVYVMYTSGSTGRPKGVAIENRGILRYVRGAYDMVPGRDGALLHVGGIGFDASTFEIWGALCNGARLVVHPDTRFDPMAMGRTIVEHGVTLAMLSAGAFHLMVDGALDSLAGLDTVIAVGDVLSPGHAARCRRAHPATRLFNAYGPTEATVSASVYVVGDLEAGRSVPIGRPLANTTLYVLDDAGRPVPALDEGELYIGGDGVARGYWGRADLTAERFVPDPFSRVPGARLYRTGDVVRLLDTGDLEFHGRRDDQVKIQGYRVEPGEVAAALSGHRAVTSAAVESREGASGNRQLVAVVTATYDVDPERLRRYLRRRLPEFMVPSQIVVVDTLPHTPIGKVDRGALRGLAGSRLGRAPVTATEATVARLWGDVLGVGEVAIDDDFFALGGDSLVALHLLARLHDDLGVELPLGAVFDDRTVEALARRVDALTLSRTDDADETPWPALVADPHRTDTPASPAQAQACFLSELAEDALPYQSSAVYDLRGHLDVAALQRSLQSVVDRHDVLRATFPKVRGVRMMRVHATHEVRLEVADLRGEQDPGAALTALRADSLARRVNLAELPLVRWTLARLADDHVALIQVEHHVVHDGWSFATMVTEILAAYRDFAAGRDHVAAPLTHQYGDFAVWQNSLADTDLGRRQIEFWRSTLADAPEAPVIATDRPTPAVRSYRGSSLRRELPAETVDRLHHCATRHGVTPYMVMLSAYALTLSRLAGVDDVVIGSGLANRRLAGTEALLGMFVNSVVVRVDLSGDPSVEELLARVRAASLGAFANQELPFEEVVRQLDPVRRPGHNPFFEHLFSFHDSPAAEVLVDGLDVDVLDTVSNGSAKADLNVVVINPRGRGARPDRPDGHELTVVWEYSTDIFDAATSEELLSTYLHVLDQLIVSPGSPVSAIELATPSQRRALIEVSDSDYERDASIAAVFAERLAENPGAVAVVAGDASLTYDQLDQASTRLARQLVFLGVGRGSRVGVSDDRTPAMVVALLGVLKAGGCYVGLDRSWPDARLERVLAGADVRLVCEAGGAALHLPSRVVTVLTVTVDGRGRVGREPFTRPTSRPATTPTATDLAYVSFTSGSTGEPKGVEVLHRGVVRLVRRTDYVEITPADVVLAGAPLTFDASTFEIWGPLLNGARLVLAPAGPLSTAEVAQVLTTHGVTTAFFTAAIFHRLVDREIEALARLRQVLAGGDVLSPAHVARLLAALGPTSVLVNGYGPTEATTFSCCQVLRHGDAIGDTVPIGRAIAHSSAVIVDAAQRLVPDGVAGELWIGGDGLARGYVGRPDLTADRFVANPFGGRLGERLYRTGDRVRRRRDGALEFLGRVDRQVKIRGFRVEPTEIEAVLATHPKVVESYVAAVDAGRDDKRLVAYVVASGADPAHLVEHDLAPFLDSRLPAYMVPSSYVALGELPLRSSGKVDVARLPEPASTWFRDDPSRPEMDVATIIARPVVGATPLENTLVALWQEVLGVRDVGLHDDFFDLGGHSLLAVELFAAIERTTGARLRLATIFEAPTVAGLAGVLRTDGWDVAIGSLVALTATGSRPAFFAVTAGDGNVVGFGSLARRLGPEQPFYVLQPFGLDSAAPLHRSVEAMARHYRREIRRVQPRGPYVLGGRCFGSLVAYEVARRLESAGETVALVASIDSGGPLWRTRRLANGVPYDPVMNDARVRVTDQDEGADPFADRGAADRFVEWLRAPADGDVGVSRYVATVLATRPDVQRTFTDVDGAVDAAGLIRWAWTSGRREHGMQDSMLPPRPAGVARRPGRLAHTTSRWRRAKDRVLDWVNFATRGRVQRLARRRGDEVLRVAIENAARYRAGPLHAPVVLLHASGEHFAHQRQEFAKWYGLEVDRVEHREVEATHHGMLREPDVAALAKVLERCIDDALRARPRPAGQ